MRDVTTYLSPNGGNLTHGAGPAHALKVATVQGMATFLRDTADSPWYLAGSTLTKRHIGALLREPVSGKLYAGAHANGGLWISDDGAGAHWRQAVKGLDRPHVYALAARHIGKTATLFLGTSPAGLYRSDDLGESWTEVTSLLDVPDTDQWTFPPPPHIPHVKCIVFHPTEPETIFVLIEQGALLKSTDDGKSWAEIASYALPADEAYRDLHRMIIDPANPDRFYLATGVGAYRSDDAGETWERLTRRGERMGYPDFLFLDPNGDGTVYMAGSHLNPGAWFGTGIADSSVMKSEDAGKSWTELDRGLPKPVTGAFEAMSLHHWDDGMMLTLGTATGQVYVSEDRGATWERIADGIAPVSKDDHHFPFMPPEERERAVAEYRKQFAPS